LFKEIISRIKQTDESVPYFKSGFYYYIRYEEGKEYPIYCRKKDTLQNAEEVMIDVNKLAEGNKYCQVNGINVSPDNCLVSYGIDTIGRRIFTGKIKNIATGEHLPVSFENTVGYTEWASDNKTLFYTVKDVQTLRPYKVMKHVLGSNLPDAEVYRENDETFTCFAYKSKSDAYIFIRTENKITSELWHADANKPDAFKCFLPREKGHEYDVEHFSDRFYIRTNWNAKNFRLMSTPVNQTAKSNG
jgi:Protease II